MTRVAAVVTAVALGSVSSGCLSHQYQVPRDELQRLAQLPSEARGQQVGVVQELGNRRAPPIDPYAQGRPPAPPPGHTGPSPYDDGYHTHGHVFVGIGGPVYRGGGRGYRSGRGYGPAGRGDVAVANPVGAPSAAAPATAQPFSPTQAATAGGSPAPAAAGAGGFGPATASPVGAGAAPAAPASTPSNVPAAAKGGGKKDDLAVLAVVAVALAAFAVVGLAFTEGARFDGQAAVSPQQLVYLQGPEGTERPVPLALLTEADLNGVRHGVIRDDEGYGLVQIQRAPLNRKGFAFKFDFGAMTAADQDLLAGFASHIGLGYFPHHRFGLLAGVLLGGIDDRDGNYQPRHAAVLEAQLLPLSWRRLHLGVAGQLGTNLSTQATTDGSNQLFYGGAALMEIAITTRLAFTARYDVTRFGRAVGPSVGRSFALGLGIY